MPDMTGQDALRILENVRLGVTMSGADHDNMKMAISKLAGYVLREEGAQAPTPVEQIPQLPTPNDLATGRAASRRSAKQSAKKTARKSVKKRK